jgi:hypothetical protein
MLQALSPRVKLERSPVLGAKLQALLEKKERQMYKLDVKATAAKLGDRIARLEEKKDGK